MAKLPDDWHEMSQEEREDWHKWIQEERQKAEESYKGVPDSARVICPLCDELLRYGSASYYEGFHMDSCN